MPESSNDEVRNLRYPIYTIHKSLMSRFVLEASIEAEWIKDTYLTLC